MAERRGPLLGTVLELDIGAVAAGGSCVAREGDDPRGRVVFVRHALPGERVRARVTEDRGGAYCRADAIEILTPSPDRVPPPCPYAGPGRCGGCDWQHASAEAQRRLKTAVIHDQFSRLAGLDVTDLCREVEALPGGLLGWRTRIAYAVGPDGRVGLRRHASHRVEHIERCLLGVPGVGDSAVLADRWVGVTGVEVVRDDGGALTVLTHQPGRGRPSHGRRPPDRVEVRTGPSTIRRDVDERPFAVAAAGFWQVHPAAASTFVAALLDALSPQPGELALDLYAGAGALTAALADAVGPTGRVVGVEADGEAVADATANLADAPWAEVRAGRVTAATVREIGLRPDVVVLDPPRAGAGTDVVLAVADLAPRAICYVSCDPATLARDVAALHGQGWRLERLRVFDAFPMTQHVECVALLLPDSAPRAP